MKTNWPRACAALLVTCALLLAGVLTFAHAHEDDDHGGHSHHCAVCCLQDHSPLTTAAAAPFSAPPATAVSVALSHQRSGWTAPHSTQATRGPPA